MQTTTQHIDWMGAGDLLRGPYWGCAAPKGHFLSPDPLAKGVFLAKNSLDKSIFFFRRYIFDENS